MQKNDNFIFSHLNCYAIFLMRSVIFLKLQLGTCPTSWLLGPHQFGGLDPHYRGTCLGTTLFLSIVVTLAQVD